MKALNTIKGWTTKKKIGMACVALLICLCIVAAIVTPIVFCFKQGEPSEEFWSSTDLFTEEYAAATLEMEAGTEFTILNFTDIQIDLPSDLSKTGMIYKTMKKAIAEAKPSLITFSGDVAWFPVTIECYQRLVKVMDGFKIPWAISFGNHDHQGNGDLNKLGEIIQNSKYGIFKKGPRNIAGVGNYVINIKNGNKIVHSVIMMDSGDSGYDTTKIENNQVVYDYATYDYNYITEEQISTINNALVKQYAKDCTMDFSQYAYILKDEETGEYERIKEVLQADGTTKTGVQVSTSYATLATSQVEWYKWVINGVYALNKANGVKDEECLAESTCVFHIPTMDFYYAYKQWLNALIEADETTLSIMDARGRMRYYESSGCACIETGFFDTAVDLGSTKNVICGHDHVNDFSLVYEGVRLTYGVKTGKECYWQNDGTMNGGTMLKLSTDGTADLTQIYIDNYKD